MKETEIQSFKAFMTIPVVMLKSLATIRPYPISGDSIAKAKGQNK